MQPLPLGRGFLFTLMIIKRRGDKKMKKTSKAKIAGALGLVILVVVMGLLYVTFREKPVAGTKNVTLEVVNAAGTVTTYEVQTEAEFLQQVMDEAEGLQYSGSDGEYGMMIDTVNGEIASYDVNKAYWGFFVNGEYCNYGIAEQPVEDGDVFQIAYTPAE